MLVPDSKPPPSEFEGSFHGRIARQLGMIAEVAQFFDCQSISSPSLFQLFNCKSKNEYKHLLNSGGNPEIKSHLTYFHNKTPAFQ